MPTSNFDKIPATIKAIEVAAPRALLDIGIGFGKYGALCREKLDVTKNRLSRRDWKVKIDGIEAFGGYRSPLWDCYDNVHVGNIKKLLPDLREYDVATVLDVIEHFEKVEGHSLIAQLLERCQVVILTTPLKWHPQEDWGGNELERHRSHWSHCDFNRYHALTMTAGENCLLAIVCRSKDRIERFRVAKYPICARRVTISLFARLRRKFRLGR